MSKQKYGWNFHQIACDVNKPQTRVLHHADSLHYHMKDHLLDTQCQNTDVETNCCSVKALIANIYPQCFQYINRNQVSIDQD